MSNPDTREPKPAASNDKPGTPAKPPVLKGDFAAGERTTPPAPEGPDFARGERTMPASTVGGDFASGEHTLPTSMAVGDFASGEHTPPTTPENPDLVDTLPPVSSDKPESPVQPVVSKGDFAAGERTMPPEPEGPDFARGERTLPASTDVGDFASGEHTLPVPPENPEWRQRRRLRLVRLITRNNDFGHAFGSASKSKRRPAMPSRKIE